MSGRWLKWNRIYYILGDKRQTQPLKRFLLYFHSSTYTYLAHAELRPVVVRPRGVQVDGREGGGEKEHELQQHFGAEQT